MRTWKRYCITLSLFLFLTPPALAASPSRGNNGTPPGQTVVTPTPAETAPSPSPTPEQTAPSPTPTSTQPEPSPIVTSPTPTPIPERHTRPTPTPTIEPQINFDGQVIPSPTPTDEPSPTPMPAVLGATDETQPPKVVQQLAKKTIELIRPPLSHLFPQLSDSAYAEQRLLSPAQSLSLFVLSLCFFYLGARLLRPRLVKKWERRLLKKRQPVPEQPWLPHYQT